MTAGESSDVEVRVVFGDQLLFTTTEVASQVPGGRAASRAVLGRRQLDVPQRARPPDGPEPRLRGMARALRQSRHPGASPARPTAHLGDHA